MKQHNEHLALESERLRKRDVKQKGRGTFGKLHSPVINEDAVRRELMEEINDLRLAREKDLSQYQAELAHLQEQHAKEKAVLLDAAADIESRASEPHTRKG